MAIEKEIEVKILEQQRKRFESLSKIIDNRHSKVRTQFENEQDLSKKHRLEIKLKNFAELDNILKSFIEQLNLGTLIDQGQIDEFEDKLKNVENLPAESTPPEPTEGLEGQLAPITREKIVEKFKRKTGEEITPETSIENYEKIGNLEIAAGSSVGVEREGPDEDSLFVGKSVNNEIVLVLADGAGGMGSGDVASRIVVDAIRDNTIRASRPTDNLPELLQISYKVAQETLKKYYDEGNYKGQEIKKSDDSNPMATCVTAIIKPDGNYVIANLGDSRAYKIGVEGISRLTKDHSLVQELVDKNAITDEERYSHNKRNIITKSLAAKGEIGNPDIFSGKLNSGEKIMLSCDGVWEEIRDPQIFDVIKRSKNPYEAVANLIHQANENGGRDNATVVLAERKEIPAKQTAPTKDAGEQKEVPATETKEKFDFKKSLEQEIKKLLEPGQSIKKDELVEKLVDKKELIEILNAIRQKEKNYSDEIKKSRWRLGKPFKKYKDFFRYLFTSWNGIEARLPRELSRDHEKQKSEKKYINVPNDWIPSLLEINNIYLNPEGKIIFYLREKIEPTQERISFLEKRIIGNQARLDEVNKKIAAKKTEIEKLIEE